MAATTASAPGAGRMHPRDAGCRRHSQRRGWRRARGDGSVGTAIADRFTLMHVADARRYAVRAAPPAAAARHPPVGAAIDGDARSDQIEMIGGVTKRPGGLDSEARTSGNSAAMARKSSSWRALSGWSGSSAQARCSSAGRAESRVRVGLRHVHASAGVRPSRFMPVSTWMAAGSAGRYDHRNRASSRSRPCCRAPAAARFPDRQPRCRE